jgi:hypothetical protein
MRVRDPVAPHPLYAHTPLRWYFVGKFKFSAELMVSYFYLMIVSDPCLATTAPAMRQVMPRAIRRSKILMQDNDVMSPVAASSSVRSSTAAAGIGAGKTGHQEKGPSTPPARIAPASHGSSGRPSATSGARHFVARISSRAKSAPRIHFHLRRTYSGRPSSSMRFSDTTAMASSVVCRPSVRERSASPITRL